MKNSITKINRNGNKDLRMDYVSKPKADRMIYVIFTLIIISINIPITLLISHNLRLLWHNSATLERRLSLAYDTHLVTDRAVLRWIYRLETLNDSLVVPEFERDPSRLMRLANFLDIPYQEVVNLVKHDIDVFKKSGYEL